MTLTFPPVEDLLITMTIAIDRAGNVYQDTQTHDNSWPEVYRGTMGIKHEIDRLISEQRVCPYHPKHETGIAAEPAQR